MKGEAKEGILDEGVLGILGHMLVPHVGNFIFDIVVEDDNSKYCIFLGKTKKYRDLR